MIADSNGRDALEIICEKPDRKGSCKVVARYRGEDIHHDQIPPYENWRRANFAEGVKQKLGERLCNGSKIVTPEYLAVFPYNGGGDDEDLAWIGDKVIAAAKDIEEKAASPASWRPKIIMADQITPRKREWTWPHRLVQGGLNLLAGMPDQGKSLITTDIISRITRGAPWPDCDAQAPLGGAVILSQEDDLETTVRPRLDAAGADCSRVALLQGVRLNDGADSHDRLIALDTDIMQVEAAIGSVPDCRIVVIDPISAYMGAADDHKNAAVRGVLTNLADMAARCRIAVLMLSHLRKGEDKHVANRVMGSMAYVAVSRMVWLATWHTTADQNGEPRRRRVVVIVKGNLTSERTGLEYDITTKHSNHDEPHIEWSAAPIDLTADEALDESGGPRRGPKPQERDKAVVWLRGKLSAGRRKAVELYEEAERDSISAATLKRAKAFLLIVPHRDNGRGAWWWQLPHPKALTGAASAGGVPADEWAKNWRGTEAQVPEAQLAKHELLDPLGPLSPEAQEDQVAQEDQETQEDQVVVEGEVGFDPWARDSTIDGRR